MKSEENSSLNLVLGLYFRGNTIANVVKYLESNPSINKKIIDEILNSDLRKKFDKVSFRALQNIIKYKYLKFYKFINNVEFENIKSFSLETLESKFSDIEILELKTIFSILKKLELIDENEKMENIINNAIDASIENTKIKNEEKEKVREEKKLQNYNNYLEKQNEKNKNKSLNRYIDIINSAYKLYLNDISYDEIINQIPIIKNGNNTYIRKNLDILHQSLRQDVFDFLIDISEYILEEVEIKKCGLDPKWFRNSINQIYIDIYPIQPEILKKRIDLYILKNNLTSEQANKFNKVLQGYKEYYLTTKESINNTKKQKSRNRNMELANAIISEYVQGNYTSVSRYCKEKKISYENFNKYLNILKEENSTLFFQFVDYVNTKGLTLEKQQKLIEEAKKIVEFIENGVNDNEKIREFNILDYYSLTSSSFNEMLKIIDKLDVNEYRTLKTFMAQYSQPEMNSIELNEIYSVVIRLNVEYDKDGKIIENTGSEIPIEFKRKVVSLLESYKIPVTYVAYKIAFDRLLKGKDIINNNIKMNINNKKK